MPVGLIGIVLVSQFIRNYRGATKRAFDGAGFALNGAALAGIMYGMSLIGGRGGDWMTGGTELLELPPPKDDKLDKEMKEQFWRMPSALVRVLFHHGVRVIDGVRRPLELDNSRSVLQWFNIHTFVIWIEDPRKPHVKDNTTITKEHADAVILNDGTKDDLEKKIVDCLHKHLDFVDVPDVVVDSKPGLVDANGRPV